MTASCRKLQKCSGTGFEKIMFILIVLRLPHRERDIINASVVDRDPQGSETLQDPDP
jgi:hypothetical protein